jgi:hypothetical protein
MPQQDFFNINPDPVPAEKKETLDEKFARERLEWSEKVASMSQQMKSVMKVAELMTEVYTERQRCVEYHHYLISILIKLNREYKRQYDERWVFWTHNSNIRYPNESQKGNKIQTELADLLEKREAVDNHSKFILSTCSTIDNLIYAIPKRIEVEQISRGK